MDNLDNQTQENEQLEQDPNLEQVVDNQEDNNQVDNNQVQNQENPKEVKQRESLRDRYTKMEKSYNELRSFSDKRYNESIKQMQEMQKQLEYFSPYKDALAQALEQKKQAELQKLYQENPIEAQKKIAEEAARQREEQLQKQYAPIQEQFERMQNEQFVNQTVTQLEQTYGKEIFDQVKEPMAQILQSVEQNAGKEAANLLARNPNELFHMAFGKVALDYVMQQRQQKQVGATNQNRAQQFARGVAKPQGNSRQVTSLDSLSDAELEKMHYQSLANQYK